MIDKKKEEKICTTILILSIVQIFLLINFSIAEGYIIGGFEDSFKENIILEKSKDLIKSSLNLLIGFLSIKQIGFVSAVTTCCEKTNSGAYCQEISDGSCGSGMRNILSSCRSTTYCKSGYCTDSDYSVSRGYKTQCPNSWSLNAPTLGCCNLRENTQINNEAWCLNNNGVFDGSIISDSECAYYSDEKGACVYEIDDGTKTCVFESEKDCSKRTIGNPSFAINTLCTHTNIDSNCVKQESINCDDGKIYWFDSCGNRENIYTGNDDSEKTRSWSDGIVDKTGLCTFDSSNTECGNCDRSNSVCQITQTGGVAAGDFFCKDLGCDEGGDGTNDRQNGESWCFYEGQVGENMGIGINGISTDIPGTRHFLKECSQGDIKTTSCGDYRRNICGENRTNDISVANCRPNLAVKCLGINSTVDCQNEPDCRMHKVDASSEFKFDLCVPKYPIGFNPSLKVAGYSHDAASICGIATQTCTIAEQKKIVGHKGFGGWGPDTGWTVESRYLANEECDKNPGKFYSQMNDLCISLGDCGGYINVVGNYSGRQDVSQVRYNGLNNTNGSYDDSGDPPMRLGGDVSFKEIDVIVQNLISDERKTLDLEEEEKKVAEWKQRIKLGFTVIGAIIGALFGGIGTLAGAAAGAALGALFADAIETAFFPGAGDIKETPIVFTCKEWSSPNDGSSCKKCNEGDLPCSKYFCESLGRCKILENNQGVQTDEPICVERYVNDAAPPLIEFKEVSVGYQNTTSNLGVSINTTNNECVSSHSLLNVLLETDKNDENKYSKCLWSTKRLGTHEDYKTTWSANMPESGDAWMKTHNFSIRIPYYGSSLVPQKTNSKGDYIDSEFNFYVKCERDNKVSNVDYYIVNFCVEPVPDITPPIIEKFEPINGILGYESSEFGEIKVYTNEPSKNCKYSISDMNYEDMTLTADSCSNPEIYRIDNYCTFNNIPGLTNPTNNIYFRCEDYSGNNMSRSKTYTITESQNNLGINPVSPKGLIEVGSIDGVEEIEIEVMTSGGALGNGVADCSFKYSSNSFVPFFETGSNSHKQILNFVEGEYNIPIRCEDFAGNVAEENIIFELNIDVIDPVIATIYKSGGDLVVTTYEESNCYYNTTATNCNFEKDARNNMEPNLANREIIHEVNWDTEKIYQIQCRDRWGLESNCVKIAPSYF